MNPVLKFFKKGSHIAWLATTLVATAVAITANILTDENNTDGFYNIICSTELGGKIAQTRPMEDGMTFELDEGIETKKDALENAEKVSTEICEEGMVLLKNENNALPLKKNAKVSVFGKNSVNLVYGGSGSAAPGGDMERKTIFDSLKAAGFSYNETLEKFYKDNDKSGQPRPGNPGMDDQKNGKAPSLSTGETDVSKYTEDITSTYGEYGDAALVVFSRIAGEGWDLPRVSSDNPEDPTGHYLKLDNNEKALLKHIASSGKFAHIVVLFNTSNNIDCGFLKFEDDPAYEQKVDAAIMIGSPGGVGIMALGKILSGEVNPSGHTVDTLYTHYENDPTWMNFGDNRVFDSDKYALSMEDLEAAKTDRNRLLDFNFCDYEENIYFGYRYYETRGKDDENWYNQNVVYPFGYGLSYTTFEHELLNKSTLEAAALTKDSFEIEVKVKNTGTVAGKDVVEIYAEAPYTVGGIEKAYKVLVGYEKTPLIEAGKDATVKVTVTPYDFASFDYNDKNANSFKGYELEAGDYVFHVGTDAHHDTDTFTKALATGIQYEKDPVTGTKVKPLYEDADDHLQESLSRSDFAGTMPKMPTDADRIVDQDFVDQCNSRSSGNKEDFDEMPWTDEEVTVMFKELCNLDYDDPLWETFLDQMTFDEYKALFNGGCYSTKDIFRLGIPKTTSFDGPTGIVAFLGDKAVYDTCYYCSECLVAQTWNLELAEAQGKAIGNEALIGNERGDKLPYSGWYGPGVNMHRSPFGGRNTEYYSEDPFQSGKCAATVVKAVQKYGVYANVKHFALNDQETNRDTEGKLTWCNEQAIREIYLKPFEMAVKEGKTRGIMSSFNRIGTKWTGGDYRLLTTILREEWGFVGSVICDFHVNDYMSNKQMCYAGGDLNLNGAKPWSRPDEESEGDVTVLRRAAHNLLYCVVNSNIMTREITGYFPPIWQTALWVGEGVIGAGMIAWGVLIFIPFIKSLKSDKEEPKEEETTSA